MKTKKLISAKKWKSIKKDLPGIFYSIKKWTLIIGILILLVIIGNFFQKITGGCWWIIFVLDLIFCGTLFAFINFTINNSEKTFLKLRVIIVMIIVLIILLLLLVIIISHLTVASESALERSNIVFFPIMVCITIVLVVKNNRGWLW